MPESTSSPHKFVPTTAQHEVTLTALARCHTDCTGTVDCRTGMEDCRTGTSMSAPHKHHTIMFFVGRLAVSGLAHLRSDLCGRGRRGLGPVRARAAWARTCADVGGVGSVLRSDLSAWVGFFFS
jgi:hypothetical protein